MSAGNFNFILLMDARKDACDPCGVAEHLLNHGLFTFGGFILSPLASSMSCQGWDTSFLPSLCMLATSGNGTAYHLGHSSSDGHCWGSFTIKWSANLDRWLASSLTMKYCRTTHTHKHLSTLMGLYISVGPSNSGAIQCYESTTRFARLERLRFSGVRSLAFSQHGQ
jgi:hypothetical protein